MPYKVNGPNWEKALEARRAARQRYNASEKRKAVKARAKEKAKQKAPAPREKVSAFERMPDATHDPAVILPKPKLEARLMAGVWYEDDPRLVRRAEILR
jgi:hypothetical protein